MEWEGVRNIPRLCDGMSAGSPHARTKLLIVFTARCAKKSAGKANKKWQVLRLAPSGHSAHVIERCVSIRPSQTRGPSSDSREHCSLATRYVPQRHNLCSVQLRSHELQQFSPRWVRRRMHTIQLITMPHACFCLPALPRGRKARRPNNLCGNNVLKKPATLPGRIF